jgi:polyisoprenoid-binding protein YceI
MKFLTALTVILLYNIFQAPAVYEIDLKKSTIRWEGYYLFDYGSHFGTMNMSKGEIQIKNQAVTSGYFEMDMKSIKDLDMKDDDGGNDLSNHLQSVDFFSTEKFPKASFQIVKIDPVPNAIPGRPNTEVIGTLSLKGITNTLQFPATVQIEADQVHVKARFKFDRTKWGVQYNSGKFFASVGDGAISDAIGIELDIFAAKK